MFWKNKFDEKRSILDICLNVKEFIQGSNDDTTEDFVRNIAILNYVKENWETLSKMDKNMEVFDSLVCQMVCVCLKMGKNYLFESAIESWNSKENKEE